MSEMNDGLGLSLHSALQAVGALEGAVEETMQEGKSWQPAKQPSSVHFVHSGLISHRLVYKDGREVSVNRSMAGDFIGWEQVVATHPQANWLTTILPARTTRVPLKTVKRAVAENAQCALAFSHAIARRCAAAEALSACNALKPLDVRLARYLCTLASESKGPLPTSQHVLAQELGVRRSSVSLVLDRFRKSGFLETRRGQVWIKEGAGLDVLAQTCE